MSSQALPLSAKDLHQRGWEQLDVVLVSGDAYVDHPSFAAAILGRTLESEGFRVGILSQPDWREVQPFRALGRPRLFFGVTSGNVDSMLAHYTPRRRRRHDDPYSPGGRAGARPDRAAVVYAQRCREAYRDVPIVVGGIEASLRRLAHWDHWSRTVRPSLLLSSRADLLVYGMGESLILALAHALARGEPMAQLRSLPSICFLLGQRESVVPPGAVELPSFENCRDEPTALATLARLLERHGSRPDGQTLVQWHGDRLVVHRPPAPPPSPADLDRWYGLPFTRQEHPDLPAPVPALETVRWSVVTHRGCFGGCSFCSVALHQGRCVVSRSRESIRREIAQLAARPDFAGVITDLGGPSANMYGLGCTAPTARQQACRRQSCLWPRPCKHLCHDPGPWLELLAEARQVPVVKMVRVASGVRMDLLLLHPRALDVLVRHHVGGQLKVAPEHAAAGPLKAMRKYPPGTLTTFKQAFDAACREAGKKLFLVPYLMAAHPGTSLQDMVTLARELRTLGLRPRQVQDFTPTPMTLSTAQHVAGFDPVTHAPTPPVQGDGARADQRALLQWFLPEHAARARRLLQRLGALDLLDWSGARPDRTGPVRRNRRTHRR